MYTIGYVDNAPTLRIFLTKSFFVICRKILYATIVFAKTLICLGKSSMVSWHALSPSYACVSPNRSSITVGKSKSGFGQGFAHLLGKLSYIPWHDLSNATHLSSSHTGGHSWDVMYTSSREILKGGRILDQTMTCSFQLHFKIHVMLYMSCITL